jgi:hypothetical protein
MAGSTVLLTASVVLMLLTCCGQLASAGVIATHGCVRMTNNDTTPWLSVVRGFHDGKLTQFWLSHANAYMTKTTYGPPPRGFVLCHCLIGVNLTTGSHGRRVRTGLFHRR